MRFFLCFPCLLLLKMLQRAEIAAATATATASATNTAGEDPEFNPVS